MVGAAAGRITGSGRQAGQSGGHKGPAYCNACREHRQHQTVRI
jgi:hypothetical protein